MLKAEYLTWWFAEEVACFLWVRIKGASCLFLKSTIQCIIRWKTRRKCDKNASMCYWTQKVWSAAAKYCNKAMYTAEWWPGFLSKQSSERAAETGKAQILTVLLAWKHFHMCIQAQSEMPVPALLLCLLRLNRHKRLINRVALMLTKRNSLDACIWWGFLEQTCSMTQASFQSLVNRGFI